MAWHEAGDAVCSFYLPEKEPIQSVSNEPDNDAFGAMQSSPRRKMNLTYISCLNEISVAMAGRLSEEMFQKEIASSCIHELDKIQAIELHMVCELGMGKRTGIITWMCHNSDSNGLMLFSEVQRNDIYADVKKIMQEAEQAARDILESHCEHVRKLAIIFCKERLSRAKICQTNLVSDHQLLIT